MKNNLEEFIERPDKYSIAPKDCRKFLEDNYSWEKVDFEKVAMGLISH